jgi:hydroxymethylglutaryl-CoA reductase (NADPH)
VLKTTRLSAKNPIEMMVASLILGSVTYVYLFNLAKSSEILTSATFQSTAQSTILYSSSQDTSFSPLIDYIMLDPPPKTVKRLELKQLEISTEKGLSKDNLINILKFQNYIESGLHFSDGILPNTWTYRDDLCYKMEANKCFVQSPLEIWNNDIKKLQSDRDPLSKLKFALSDNQFIISYVFDLNDSYHAQAAGLWEKIVTSSSLDNIVPLTSYQHSESTSTIVWIMRVIKNIIRDTSIRMNVRLKLYK